MEFCDEDQLCVPVGSNESTIGGRLLWIGLIKCKAQCTVRIAPFLFLVWLIYFQLFLSLIGIGGIKSTYCTFIHLLVL